MIVDRAPWPADFPEVYVHSDLKSRDRDPDFKAAKGGDDEAALRLAGRLVSRAVMASHPEQPFTVLLPVTALETGGFNAIPDAMAQVMAGPWGSP